MTGRPDSTLGRLADAVLDIGRVEEACPMRLAPPPRPPPCWLGDALAMVVLAERGFERSDYARSTRPGPSGAA